MMYICKNGRCSGWHKKSELKNERCPFCGAAVVVEDVPEVDDGNE